MAECLNAPAFLSHSSRSSIQARLIFPTFHHAILHLMRACAAETRHASLSQSYSLPSLVFKCLSSLASSPFAAKQLALPALEQPHLNHPCPRIRPRGSKGSIYQSHISNPPHLPSYLLSLYLIKWSDAAIGAAADCHFPPPYFSLCVPSLLYEGAAFYQLHLNRPRPRARPLVRQEFASPACTLSSSPFRYYALLGVRILLSPVLILRYCRVYLLPPCFGTVQYYRVCLS